MQYPRLSRYPKFHAPVARRLFVIGLLLLLMLPTVEAQRKKVGVVLSGGGASTAITSLSRTGVGPPGHGISGIGKVAGIAWYIFLI